MNASAARQIAALQQEKAMRPAAQKNVDSNVLYALSRMAGQPAAFRVELLYTGVELESKDNRVFDVVALVSGDLLKEIVRRSVIERTRGAESLRMPSARFTFGCAGAAT
jgi:hypothetical protein